MSLGNRFKKVEGSRLELLLKNIPPTGIGVEVGVFRADFASSILKNWKGTLYLVDIWRKYWTEEENDALDKAISNIKEFDEEDRAIMIRCLSKNAIELFDDESLDFVYIDANHSYESVKQDLEMWWPKIKKGGCLSGHDYIDINWYEDPNFAENKKDKHIWSDKYVGLFGVNPAVDEFCEKHDLYGTLGTEWFGSYYITKK